MKFSSLFFLLLISCYGEISGQSGAFPQELDRYFKSVLQASPAPGFSVVVVREDQIIFEKGYGLERSDAPMPMTANTSTAIGSLTKSFTALAMMQLVEAGKVDLDDPVTKYLPEFTTANKKRSNQITVRMLLDNTSGLQGGVSNRLQDDEKALDQLLESLQSFYLTKEPGKSYEYANTGFSLAGLIIERVSGLPYAKYLEQYIFQPLDMKRTSTDPDDFDDLQVLYGHRTGIDRGIPAGRDIESVEMIPAGSMLRSTASDLGNYLIALLNGGRYQMRNILSSQSIAAMWAPQINFPGISYEMGGDGADFQYGLGWMISEVEGRTLIHHGGSRGTMSSMTILIPEKKLAASILINLDDNYIDRYRFQSAFSILNNLFHLIENEKLTDFGRPRIPDPTLNDYQLPQALGEQIIGTYRFSGKGDTRNLQGAELTIFRNQNGALEARINRGETVLNHFEMDFTNKVHAVSRNIGSPIPISIKAKPDGTVTTIYFGNSEFIKLQPDFLAKYQQQHIFRFSFYFPKNWSWIFHDKHFEVRQENDPDVVMQGGINTAPSPSLKYFIRQHDPDFSPFYEGVEKTEVRGSQFWRQQSFASRKGAKIYQQMVLLNETEGFYLILATPSGKLTNEVQASLSFLMDTFTASQSLP